MAKDSKKKDKSSEEQTIKVKKDAEGNVTKVTFQKNGREKIIGEISEYKGKVSLDIRQHFFADDKWVPTGKGVKVPLEVSRKFASAMLKMVIAQLEG